MSSELRVMVSGNTSDGFLYKIEEVAFETGDAYSPRGAWVMNKTPVVKGTSIDDLRHNIQKMLDACDKPVLAVRMKIVEVPSDPPPVEKAKP